MAPTDHKTPTLGQPAPAFSLQDEQGKTWSLAALRGTPIVLIFYPGDMTPGCTVQLCAVRDDWAKFQEAGITVLGVNHGEAKTHGAFSKQHRFPFPLLVDADRSMSKNYGALHSILGLKLIRRTVIGIDREGIVTYLKAGMPKNADILKALTSKK